jgi:uridine kinase
MHKYKKHIKELPSKHLAIVPEEILAELLQKKFVDENHVLIAVGGPGGTGKSSFCEKLAELLPDSNVLHLDDYKTARKVRQGLNIFGAHPEANMMDLVLEHYITAKNGGSFHKPVYNAVTGEADKTEFFKASRFTVIDGEISTYRHFRDYVDFSIFIDSDLKTQLKTRLDRDIKQRRYSYEKAIATFLHSNLREFGEFGAESKNWADIHLYCHGHYELTFEAVAEEYFEQLQELADRSFTVIQMTGMVVPVYTPFTECGIIDRESFIRHLEYLAEAGVERIHVGGYHGEVFALSTEERLQLLLLSKRYFPGVVIFDISSENFSVSLELLEKANLIDVDAVSIMPAWYWEASRTFVEKFKRLENAGDVPVIPDMRFNNLKMIRSFNESWTSENSPVVPFESGEVEFNIAKLKQMLSEHISYPLYSRF